MADLITCDDVLKGPLAPEQADVWLRLLKLRSREVDTGLAGPRLGLVASDLQDRGTQVQGIREGECTGQNDRF